MNFQAGGKNSGKILVVYYSASGTTKSVAEKIASYLGADLFEVVPKEDYTSAELDWTNKSSHVCCLVGKRFGTRASDSEVRSRIDSIGVK